VTASPGDGAHGGQIDAVAEATAKTIRRNPPANNPTPKVTKSFLNSSPTH